MCYDGGEDDDDNGGDDDCEHDGEEDGEEDAVLCTQYTVHCTVGEDMKCKNGDRLVWGFG